MYYFHTSIFSDVFVRDKEFKNIDLIKKGYFKYYQFYQQVIQGTT